MQSFNEIKSLHIYTKEKVTNKLKGSILLVIPGGPAPGWCCHYICVSGLSDVAMVFLFVKLKS